MELTLTAGCWIKFVSSWQKWYATIIATICFIAFRINRHNNRLFHSWGISSLFQIGLVNLWNSKRIVLPLRSFVLHFVYMEQLDSTGQIFMKLFSWIFFWKFVQKIKVSVKYDRNNRHLTWRPVYIYNYISLISSWNEKCFTQFCTENQNKHFMCNNLCPYSVQFMRKCGKYRKSKQATDNDIMCWMNRARTWNM
jgi:hypothetical protein